MDQRIKNTLSGGASLLERTPGVGAIFERTSEEEAARRDHLRKYTGSLALVGSFPSISTGGIDYDPSANIVEILSDRGVISGDKPLVIRPIIASQPTGANIDKLIMTANRLGDAIKSDTGIEPDTIINPLGIDTRQQGKLRQAAHRTLVSGIKQAEQSHEVAENSHEASLGFIAVTLASEARLYNLTYMDISMGGSATLGMVGKRPHDTYWSTRAVPRSDYSMRIHS